MDMELFKGALCGVVLLKTDNMTHKELEWDKKTKGTSPW